jgi:hypothetical protein
MRQRYRVCHCSPDCTLKIKVNSCEVTSYIAVYHERDAKGCISIEREDVVLKYTRAIPEIIKKFIEDMLEDDADQTPKIILVKLIKLRKEHNLFPKEILPSLQQVIHFLHTNC